MAYETSPTIAFPLTDDPRAQRTFRGALTPRDAARSRLLLLFTTRVGEVWYNPLFGSSLREHLFNPSDQATVEQIEIVLRAEVTRWLPGLKIQRVDANQASPNRIDLRITFLLAGDPEPAELQFAVTA